MFEKLVLCRIYKTLKYRALDTLTILGANLRHSAQPSSTTRIARCHVIRYQYVHLSSYRQRKAG